MDPTNSFSVLVSLGGLGVLLVACAPPDAGPSAEIGEPTGEIAVTESTPRDSVYTNITVEEMVDLVADDSHLVINVHIPYEGEIAGTDLFIPYDEIGAHLHLLPEDEDAALVLYCMSGRMSTMAAETLASLGYTNLLHLDGGMRAWAEAGYPLEGTEPQR